MTLAKTTAKTDWEESQLKFIDARDEAVVFSVIQHVLEVDYNSLVLNRLHEYMQIKLTAG